jgi:hypothetical protein
MLQDEEEAEEGKDASENGIERLSTIQHDDLDVEELSPESPSSWRSNLIRFFSFLLLS